MTETMNDYEDIISKMPRRNVVAHLEQVFAPLASGTFLTIAQIVKTRSDEYGDDRPSPGAISARLFPVDPARQVRGFLMPMTLGGVRGAIKVRVSE